MKLKFKKWIELSNLQDKLPDPEIILQILSLSGVENSEDTPWWETVDRLSEILENNLPKKIPLFRSGAKQGKEKPEPWDYENRSWYMWSHLIASSYGWTLEYIAELETDDALALVQEILTAQQLEHERQWGMSEIAYPYNSNTKKSEYKELPRPSFMMPPPVEQKPTRILKSMLPAGLILTGKDDEPPQYS